CAAAGEVAVRVLHPPRRRTSQSPLERVRRLSSHAGLSKRGIQAPVWRQRKRAAPLRPIPQWPPTKSRFRRSCSLSPASLQVLTFLAPPVRIFWLCVSRCFFRATFCRAVSFLVWASAHGGVSRGVASDDADRSRDSESAGGFARRGCGDSLDARDSLSSTADCFFAPPA